MLCRETGPDKSANPLKLVLATRVTLPCCRRMHRYTLSMFKALFYLIVFGFLGALVAFPFYAIDDAPLVRGNVAFTADEIDEAKALLRRNDPRRLESGEMVTQWIDESEVSLVAGYLLSQLGGGGAAIELHPGRALAQLSVRMPENPIGEWLNFSLSLSQWSDQLAIEEMMLGGIVVPGWIAEELRVRGNEALKRVPEYAAALDAVNGFQLVEDRVLIAFQWRPELVDQLKRRGQDLAVDEEMKARLMAYSNQIRAVAENPQLDRRVSLVEFMKPLFFLAEARGGDAVEENRAALLALSFYFSGVDVSRMLGVSLPDKQTVSKQLTLSGRYDFAQHFLTSAALTVTGNVGLADAIGLFKELDDAGGGSGFSFTDLGADRAGVRAAEFATASASNAKKFQKLMTGPLTEDKFIPNFLDLPEFLPDEEFKARYGGVGSERYNEVVADIERRIDGVELYSL